MGPKYRDKAWLEREYVEKRRDMEDIGDECGVAVSTISRWCERLGVETRPKGNSQLRATHVPLRSDPRGYEIWDGGREKYRVHRLVAVAKYGPEAVKGNDVHHANGIKWDNRPENVVVLDPSAHSQTHASERERKPNGDFA